MPEILDTNIPIVMGNCIHVANCEKKENTSLAAEADVFICIQIENENGKDEYSILMTQEEFDNLKKGVFPDMDKMIFGRIYPKFITNKNFYCVKLKENNDNVFVGIFDIGDWAEFYKRAIEHPKSCTRKSMLTNLLD